MEIGGVGGRSAEAGHGWWEVAGSFEKKKDEQKKIKGSTSATKKWLKVEMSHEKAAGQPQAFSV